MKVLFLCGVFAKENEQKIIENAKRAVEFSANIFQKKMIQGLKETGCDYKVVSAPFVGSYPNASRIRRFNKTEYKQTEYQYVSFDNLWGYRNFSRCSALKKEIETFITDDAQEKRIIVYSPHTPFLEAAVYAKKKDPRIKICLVVPDLPQYMNLDERISLIYKVGKKYDIARFNKMNRYVDSYMLLTEYMKDMIDTHNRPYIVVEGIVTAKDFNNFYNCEEDKEKENDLKYILYTGKLNKRFGVIDLVDAFSQIKGENYRLVICGKGDAQHYIENHKDSRIMYMGQVSPAEAKNWMYKADILVNPRKNDEEYTKYSFPSKNIEYLMTGKKVVGYKLDGMPEVYRDYMYISKDDDLKKTIEDALSDEKGKQNFRDYAEQNLHTKQIAMKLLQL